MTIKGQKLSNQKLSKISQTILETADDMKAIGLMTPQQHKKITMRHVSSQNLKTTQPILAEDIRALREKANLSQAVFASCIGHTVSYVSKLERGEKKPTGATLVLLNLIKEKDLTTLFDNLSHA